MADELLTAWEAEGMQRPYRFLPATFPERIAAYEQAHGAAARAELLCGVLLDLIDRFDEVRSRPLRVNLAPSVEDEIVREHARIRAEYPVDDPQVASLNKDLFLKDLGIAALKLVPAGCALVDIRQGIPRSTILLALRRSVPHGLATAAFLLFVHRGFKPTFETHMSLKRKSEFTPEGRRLLFCRIADLLRANPEYLGVFGTTWYYDPAVTIVSPHLAYVREEPARHGAWFACVGANEETTRNAISSSNTRRALFQAGKYSPTAYMLIWPRRSLVAYELGNGPQPGAP